MDLTYTAVTAAILVVQIETLSLMVSAARAKAQVSLGDGGNPELLAAIRRHANAAEHVPMALIVMALAEMGGASPGILMTAAAALILGRLLHPFGIGANLMAWPRLAGSTLTLLATVGLAVTCIWQVLF